MEVYSRDTDDGDDVRHFPQLKDLPGVGILRFHGTLLATLNSQAYDRCLALHRIDLRRMGYSGIL